MGEFGFYRTARVKFIEEIGQILSESEPLACVLKRVGFVGLDIFFMYSVQVSDPGLRQVMDQAHTD